MLTTIEGIYNDGRIELSEKPSEIMNGETVVVSLHKKISAASEKILAVSAGEPKYIWFGMLGPGEFTEEDFKSAEFHGDPDDGLDWS